MEDLVSIITPVYNAEKYIEETIQSVLDQSYKKWELLLIDDASTDQSTSIIEHYGHKDDRIKIIKLSENSGAAVTRNIGIEKAKGRYIAFLDSDDIWLPKKLEIQINFMKDNNVSFSFAEYIKIDEDGTERGKVSVPSKIIYHELLKSNVIGCLTAMYDTQKIGKVFMPVIRKRQDLALWLKILKNHTDGYGINQCLAKYRVRGESVSSNKFKAATYQWRVYREIEKLSVLKSAYYFMNYAYYGLKKFKI